jgi:4,5-DOPA dioxygenase extradiol
MTSAPGDLARLQDHDDFAMAAPTPDHFIPLLYLAGLASVAGQTAHVLVDGYSMGSLSMASYTLGCHELKPDGQGGSPTLPHVPADGTNI